MKPCKDYHSFFFAGGGGAEEGRGEGYWSNHRRPKLTIREIDRTNDLCKRMNDLCKRMNDLCKRMNDLCRRMSDLCKRIEWNLTT